MTNDNAPKEKGKGRIVLYTFPPVPNSYSVSPFALKAESFLRVNGLPYDVVYTSAFSTKGTIPYIRLYPSVNDDDDAITCRTDSTTGECVESTEPLVNETTSDYEEVPDSNIFIDRLKDDFATTSEDNLTKSELGISHACIRMLEEHTTQIGYYYRYAYRDIVDFCNATQNGDRIMNQNTSRIGAFIFYLWKKKIPKVQRERANCRNLTRHSDDELWSMSYDDFRALEDLLGPEHNFFLGQYKATILDCAVFGHLSQFLYIDMDFPQKTYLLKSCPNLVRFMAHFKQTYWSDWDIKCQRQPNDQMRKDNPEMKIRMSKLKKKLAQRAIAFIAIVGLLVYFTSKRK